MRKGPKHGVCRHDLVRNGSNTMWVCSKCGRVWHGGGQKPEEGLTRA